MKQSIPPTRLTTTSDDLSPLDTWLESLNLERKLPEVSRASQPQPEAIGLRLLALAGLLVVLFHGSLLANRSYLRTYDALIHIFFASHYAQAWFDPWEPRWYTGFSTVSYPPLVHQLIALLSKILDLRDAFALVQIMALLGCVIGVYRFSRMLSLPRASGYAALAFVISSSMAETVHLFGQLPTTLSLAFLLNAVPFAHRYMIDGRKANLFRAIGFMAATTAAHHVTTLFGSVFFLAPVVGQVWFAAIRESRRLEPKKRWTRGLFRMAPHTYRAALLGMLVIAALVTVVFPYWAWSRSDPILQTPIPHASRENFLTNQAAGLMFFVLPWASSILFLPYALRRAWLDGRWMLALSLFALFGLGTGGTTPIPKMALRSAFDILTLDRFTFWATILILPYVGGALESILHGNLRLMLNVRIGRTTRRVLIVGFLLSNVLLAIWISTLSRYRMFQPEPIDIKPVVAFLEKDEHWRYRYLTLGFGDQMAWLSANTKALTPDGNYHSARRLIELTSSPIERLDGAKFTGVPGLGSLEQFLTQPEKYNLKFVFSNDTYYDPLLFFSGWHRVTRLENGLMIWEREDIAPLPERLPRRNIPLWQRAIWGILPPFAAVLAFSSLRLRPRRARTCFWQRRGLGRKVLRWLRQDREVTPDFSLIDKVIFAEEPLNARDSRKTKSEKVTPCEVAPQAIQARKVLVLGQEGGSREAAGVPRHAYVAQDPPGTFGATPPTSQGRTKAGRDGRWTWAMLRTSPRARWGALAVGLIAVVGLILLQHKPATATDAVLAYWDDIDFQRYKLAYDRLEPKDGLDFDRFMLDLSVRGGLRNGYAKLERIKASIIALDGDEQRPQLGHRALVRSHLAWATSLNRLEEDVTQELEFGPHGWRIQARPLLKVRARDRFTEEAAVKFYYRPRRLTTQTTAAGDVLDRPQLAVLGARLIEHTLEVESRDPQGHATRRLERAFAVVGELQNIDARPGDVTLTAILRDRDGWELRRNNAGTAIIHKLLPGERTPFRVEFIGADAPSRLSDVHSFEVFAKAVVTGRDLERPLAGWITATPKNLNRPDELLHATIANTGTREATVPRALISLYDAKGLAWVEERAIIDAILPREFLETDLPAKLPTGYRVVLDHAKSDDKGTVFDSGRKARGQVFTVPLEGVPGLRAYRVQFQAFEANP